MDHQLHVQLSACWPIQQYSRAQVQDLTHHGPLVHTPQMGQLATFGYVTGGTAGLGPLPAVSSGMSSEQQHGGQPLLASNATV